MVLGVKLHMSLKASQCTLILNKGHGHRGTDCTAVYSLTQQLRVTLHAPTGWDTHTHTLTSAPYVAEMNKDFFSYLTHLL